MKTLAKGTNSDCVFKLIKVLINAQQTDYEVALAGDTQDILDVASQIETDRTLFGEGDKRLSCGDDGVNFNSLRSQGKSSMLGGQPREKDILVDTRQSGAGRSPLRTSPNKYGSNDYFSMNLEERYTGVRSSDFDHLFDMQNPEPAERERRSRKRRQGYMDYVKDLTGGDKQYVPQTRSVEIHG